MKKTIVFLFFVLVGLISEAQQEQLVQQLDSILSVYAKLNKFNGTALIVKNSEILIDKGYGYRDAKKATRHDPSSVFQIGSVTKQFTTAVILKLQQQGKLNVKDRITKYFPGFPKGDSITIEHLMTHTSGIFNYTSDRAFMQNEVTKYANKDKIMALFVNKPLDFSPGTKFNYSNSNYMLLGYIIEAVTKKPYERVVRDLIFMPLKMTHSGFDFTHLKVKEKSTGYFALNNTDTMIAPIVDSTVAYAAGAIYSTTGDLYRWHRGLLVNKILTPEQQEAAFRPVLNNYGYGWGIDSLDGKRRLQHSGGIHGFTSLFTRIPQDDICIILLSNTSSNVLEQIANKAYAAMYNKPYDLPYERKAINLPEDKLKEYVGTYQIKPDLQLVITVKDGQLLCEPTNQPATIAYAEKEDFFFVHRPEVQLKFIRNDNKEITAFILYQGGNETECKKVK